jgi:predicted membrane protein
VDDLVSKPNNRLCDKVSIEIGMADFNSHGLGNLNSEDFSIDVGLGDANIDLTGSFFQDADVDINVGLGSLNLVLPKNANVKLSVDHSFLASVDVNDLLKKGENAYESIDWDHNLPKIDIEISVGLGDVDVRVE